MPPALRHLWGLGKEGGHGGKVERKAQCVFSEAATVKTQEQQEFFSPLAAATQGQDN